MFAIGEETQAADFAMGPRLVEIEQRAGDLGTAVGMQRAVAQAEAP
jgi:hypothetical protein